MSESTKQNKINIIKSVSFLLVFILISSVLSVLFVPKSNDYNSGLKCYTARGFYGEPKNSLDIIAIGNSNLGCGFSPLNLWKQFGYTGYNCAEPGTTIFETYDVLTEVFKCQSPKVVILETDSIFTSCGRIETFNNYINDNFTRISPLIEYHNRWKTINSDDLTKSPSYTWMDPTRGYWIRTEEKPLFKKQHQKYNAVTDQIKSVTLIQLNSIRKLCKKNNAQLVLVYIPSATSWNQTRHDNITKYAAKYDLPFLDLNTSSDDFKINWLTDTMDAGSHLNYNGAIRVTSYIGEYLSKHYTIPNHKNDVAFSRWDSDYNRYIGT